MLLFCCVWLLSSYGVYRQYLFFQESGVPGLHWDGVYYSSVTLNVADGNGWIIALTENPSVIHDRKYSGHGVLDVFIHGMVLKARDWTTLEYQFSVVNTLSFVAWLAIFVIGTQLSFNCQIRAVLLAYVLSFICMGLQGRPEHLSSLILTVAAGCWRAGIRGKPFLAVWGITSGLLFTASPILGVVSGMFTLVFVDCNELISSGIRKWIVLFIVGCTSLITSLAVIKAVQPEGVVSWVASALSRSSNALNLMGFLFSVDRYSVFGVSLAAPFWNILGFAGALTGLWTLTRHRNYLFIAIYLLLLAKTVRAAADYSVVSMYPMFFTLVACWLAEKPTFVLARVIGNLIVAANLIAIGFTFHRAWETHYGDAPRSAAVSKLEAMQRGEKVMAYNYNFRPSWADMVTPSDRWVSVYPDSQSNVLSEAMLRGLVPLTGGEIESIVYPQSYRGTPPESIFLGCSKYTRSFSNWTTDRYSLFGVNLIGHRPGFRYAVYDRLSDEIQ